MKVYNWEIKEIITRLILSQENVNFTIWFYMDFHWTRNPRVFAYSNSYMGHTMPGQLEKARLAKCNHLFDTEGVYSHSFATPSDCSPLKSRHETYKWRHPCVNQSNDQHFDRVNSVVYTHPSSHPPIKDHVQGKQNKCLPSALSIYILFWLVGWLVVWLLLWWWHIKLTRYCLLLLLMMMMDAFVVVIVVVVKEREQGWC